MPVSIKTRDELNIYVRETHRKELEKGTLSIKNAVKNFKGSNGDTIGETFFRKVCNAWDLKLVRAPKKITKTTDKVDILIRSLGALYGYSKKDTPEELQILLNQLPIELTSISEEKS